MRKTQIVPITPIIQVMSLVVTIVSFWRDHVLVYSHVHYSAC